MMTRKRALKKGLAMLLCIVMIVTMLPEFAMADELANEADAVEEGLISDDPVLAEQDVLTPNGEEQSEEEQDADVEDLGSDKDSEEEAVLADETEESAPVVTEPAVEEATPAEEAAPAEEQEEEEPPLMLTPDALPAPTLTGIEAVGTGIKITWNKVTGAAKYRVYRQYGSVTWKTIANVSGTSYVDNNTTAGIKYTYTVRCLDSNGALVSGFDSTGLTGTCFAYPEPQLKSAIVASNGIRVTWNKVSGVAKYRVFRRVDGSTTWVNLGDTTNDYWPDLKAASGTKYFYTVRGMDSSNKYITGFDKTGIGATFFSQPVLVSVTSATDGLRIDWKAVTGVTQYCVFRKSGNDWISLATVSGTTYIDKSVSQGASYTYTVCCLGSDGKTMVSTYDSKGMTGTFYGAPKMISAVSQKDGILVTWQAVPGAPNYRVFRKVGSGNWNGIGNTTATSYLDKNVDSGKEYTYTVRVISKDGVTWLSYFDTTGVSCIFAGKVEITGLSNQINGVKVSWNTITGAANYRLYRKTDDAGLVTLGDFSGSSTVDTDVVSNRKYTYVVRALDSSGNFMGAYDADGKSITFFAAPTLVDAERANTGIKVTWEAVEGISNYRVFRKADGASWIGIGNVASTTYIDNSVVGGVTYTYTVRGISADGKTWLTACDLTGVSCTSPEFYASPLLTGVKADSTGILVTWQAVDGAPQYIIYRKDGSKTSWDPIATVPNTPTEYLDNTVTITGKYSYTVACADGSGNEASEKNETGLSTTYYAAPVLEYAIASGNSVKVSWKHVDGVKAYRVFRKTENGSWIKLADVSSTATTVTYIDSSVKNSQHYVYTVCCLVGGQEMSSYDETGVETRFYIMPQLLKVANGNGGVGVKWAEVDGIKTYRVYRKQLGVDSNWVNMGDVGSAYYFDSSVTPTGKYFYTVRCVDGGKLVSDFDHNGIGYMYLEMPTVSTIAGSGIATVKWTPISGAKTYRIYRKRIDDANWTEIARVSSTVTTYTDKNLGHGITYYYTVRAVSDNFLSDFNPAGVSVVTK